MKILVIEDNELHADAAVAQLKGHDVTVVRSADAAYKLLEGELGNKTWERLPHEFEVVLTDLMMPSGRKGLSDTAWRNFEGREVPVGIFLAMLAATNGAQYVGLITDTGHHDHPCSAMLDPFKAVFQMGGAKFLAENYHSTAQYFPEDLTVEVKTWEMPKEQAERAVSAKMWAKLLEKLLK